MVLAPDFSESIFHNLDRREKTLAEQVLGEGSNYRTGLFRKTKKLRPNSIINPGKISSRATRFSSQCSLTQIKSTPQIRVNSTVKSRLRPMLNLSFLNFFFFLDE